jgi:hypothetical protein
MGLKERDHDVENEYFNWTMAGDDERAVQVL